MNSLFAKILAGVSICYGMVSFGYMDINPASWGYCGRSVFIFIATVAGLMTALIDSEGAKR